jgi:hypothetical protein
LRQKNDGKRVCIGAPSLNQAHDTIGNLKRFITGQDYFCGEDERGIQCWNSDATFEKPLNELLAQGDAHKARFSVDYVCVPHADKTIHCHTRGQNATHPETRLSSYTFPAVQIYGPFADLRDFQIGTFSDQVLCVLDGDQISCESLFTDPYKTKADRKTQTFEATLSGAKAIATYWSAVCVAEDKGLTCLHANTNEQTVLRDGDLELNWSQAVTLSTIGYNTYCATDANSQPMCFTLNQDGTPQPFLASIFSDPNYKTLKFETGGGYTCAQFEVVATGEQELHCGSPNRLDKIKNLPPFKDFEVNNSMACIHRNDGLIDCFSNVTTMPSPLPYDGSETNVSGRCRWNNSRFHCDKVGLGSAFVNNFKEVKKVVSTSKPTNQDYLCVLFEDQTDIRRVACLSPHNSIQTDIPVPQSHHTKIAANDSFACLYGDGVEASCWGSLVGGVEMPNLTKATAIEISESFACATDRFGFLCWGRNLEGRSLVPPQALQDRDAVLSFALGDSHACAITYQQQVNCWGNNSTQALNGPLVTSATSIAASRNTTCVSDDSDGVQCWGDVNTNLIETLTRRLATTP